MSIDFVMNVAHGGTIALLWSCPGNTQADVDEWGWR